MKLPKVKYVVYDGPISDDECKEHLKQIRALPETLKKLELAEEMARYIVEFEEDDFYYHDPEPSEQSIYLVALRFLDGDEAAKEALEKVRSGL